MTPHRVMTKGLSAYLDLLRFGAAIIVLLSHFAYNRFTDGTYGIIRSLNLGSDAVVLFFVLSGFVITYAAKEKDKSGQRFAFSRSTRLWSVAIPTLALTFFLDRLGIWFNPEFYIHTPYYNNVGFWEYWWRGLTFSNHWAGDNLRLGSNGPFWSLSYEAAYYITFAIMLYMRGVTRWLALVLCAFVFGLKIWLLAPAWFMGVGLYLFLQRVDVSKISITLRHIFIAAPLALYVISQYANLPDILRQLTLAWFGADQIYALGFSDEFVWNAVIGAFFSLHLFGVSLWLMDRDKSFAWQPAIKWLAGGSFSLYLVHYPVLQWGGAVFPRSGIWVLDHSLLLGFVLLVCYCFAAIFERPLPLYRSALGEMFKGRAAIIND